ncbi:DUF1127 domain-containing protein [Mesorhizobium sp. IRAMC:0171]|uniref:DUF1127 domain-containing protein n=1 Tax=Mesorhizobium retamae TaxID=2912854 RepID=A0ABS9QCY2_9HYPH|nr:DUF1127 domain-containing protein [Mesorhizobium sp. IRAMC:0171]MCG7505280.1 DUF1127 domain-containing protein [Mesorhizobium sp. IRAMC:0171]
MASAIETISRRQSSSVLHGERLSGFSGFCRRVTVMMTSSTTWLGQALERRRSRLALLEMTDEQLKDIGVTRSDAYREGTRSFFD